MKAYLSSTIALATIILLALASGCSPDSTALTAQKSPEPPRGAYADYDSLRRLAQAMSTDEVARKIHPAYDKPVEVEEAMAWCRIVLSRTNDTISTRGRYLYAGALQNLGYLWLFEKNNAEQAYPMFMRVLDMAATNDSIKAYEGAVYSNLGKIYLNYNDTEKAIAFYKRGFDAALRHNRAPHVTLSYADLLHATWLNGNLSDIESQSRSYLAQRMPPSAKGQYLWQYAHFMEQARQSSLRGDHAQVLSFLDIANEALPSGPDTPRYSTLNRLIKSLESMRANNQHAAIEALGQAQRTIAAHQLIDLQGHCYDMMASCHRAFNQPDKAAHYDYRALQVRDSLWNASRYGALRDIETSWTAQKHDAQINAETKRREQWQLVAWIVGVGAIIILSLLALALCKIRQLNKSRSMLFHKNMQLAERDDEPANKGENPDGGNGDPLLADVYAQLCDFMGADDRIYDPGFSLDALSTATGFKPRMVSQAINSVGRQNFHAYLNEYRIRKACQLLGAAPAMRPTIEDVAEQVGYRSRSHFSKLFKEITGLTTSQFIQQAQRERGASASDKTGT